MRSIVRTVFPAALLASFLVAAPVAGQMQESSPTCSAPAAPTGALAAWATPGALTAATDQRRASRANFAIGQAARMTLLPTPQVHYPLRPEKPGGSVSYGGLVQISVREAGTYRIALGSAAWIDLVKHGKPVASVAHGHGPDCTGIRKIVDFSLTQGRYILQIAANGTPEVTVLAARLP
jgi:hypothetical protein